MSVEVLLVVATVIAGIYGVIKGIKESHLYKSNKKIKIQIGDMIIELQPESKDEIGKILSKLQAIEGAPEKEKITPKEEGFVGLEVLLFIVPGIIALLFAGTFVYLLVENQANPEYKTPQALETAMTTILGYYFGVGASSAASKGKTLSPEEVKALMDE